MQSFKIKDEVQPPFFGNCDVTSGDQILSLRWIMVPFEFCSLYQRLCMCLALTSEGRSLLLLVNDL